MLLFSACSSSPYRTTGMLIISVIGTEDYYSRTTIPIGRKAATTQYVRVPNSGSMQAITPGNSTSEAYALSLSIGSPSDLRLVHLDLNTNTCSPVHLPPLDDSPVVLIKADLFYADGTLFVLCARGLLTITMGEDGDVLDCRILCGTPPYFPDSRFRNIQHVWASGKLCYRSDTDVLQIVDTKDGSRTSAVIGGTFDRFVPHSDSLYAWTKETDRVYSIDLVTGIAASPGSTLPCVAHNIRRPGYKIYDFSTRACYLVENFDLPVQCWVYCTGPSPLKLRGIMIRSGFVIRQAKTDPE